MEGQLLISFYGDDFTGSTDVLEALALAHIPVALFLEPPSLEKINTFQFKNSLFAGRKLQAVGVAGISRTFTNEQAVSTMPSIFEKMAALKARFFHYKICSTFDSSPTHGSIGLAIDVASNYFESRVIPLLVGMPRLNRFVVFGNLFARVQDTTYRLDRHPTMSRHPVTPMGESDVLRHLSKQTEKRAALIDVLTLGDTQKTIPDHLDELVSKAVEIVLFDTLSPEHLGIIGKGVTSYFSKVNQLIVGSSAVEHALFPKREAATTSSPGVGKAKKMIVVSGSCSPMAAEQIIYARQNGFDTVAIDTVRLLSEQESGSEQERLVNAAAKSMESYRPIVYYSALGLDDPSLPLVKRIQGGQERLPLLLGRLLSELILRYEPERVVAAGGDTSGKIAQVLGIEALEFLMEMAPGVPLCISHARRTEFNNIQIILKGGQNGNPSFYEEVYRGIKY